VDSNSTAVAAAPSTFTDSLRPPTSPSCRTRTWHHAGRPVQPGGPPWEVTAQRTVRCDGVTVCGMHTIEAWPASRHDAPLEAAIALARAARWLLDARYCQAGRVLA
jgi:hypothetical protein